MAVWMCVLLFGAGLLLVVKGGNAFVDAAVWLAEVSGVPKFLIGATVVSLATTMPEMLVSLIAAMQGRIDMAVGNAVGSVTVNAALIMGLSAVVAPGNVNREHFSRKALIMIASAVTVAVAMLRGSVGLAPSLILLLLFLLFALDSALCGRREMGGAPGERRPFQGKEMFWNLVRFLLGAGAIVLGADLMVENGSLLALAAGVPQSVVGVTLLAAGTSLPEMVTAVTAIKKRQAALSVGNILGANIIDLTLILPASALAAGKPLSVSRQGMLLDAPALAAVVALAALPTMLGGRLSRWQGIAMAALYGVYLTLVFVIF